MKLVCEYLVLTERVIEDAHTRTVTAISLLDRVHALKFPTQHHGFACIARFRVDGPAPTKEVPVQYRLLRLSDHEDDQILTEESGQWRAGARTSRFVAAFQVLRLMRAETLGFRFDHRVGNGRWVRGPVTTLAVEQITLTPEAKSQLRAQLASAGLPVTDLD